MYSSGGNMTNESCLPYAKSPSPIEEPKASENFRTIFMAFIVMFSIVGNSLVLRGAISRRNRPFVYYLVINLSIAELVGGGIRPFIMVEERTPFDWEFGNFMCQFVVSCYICTTVVVTFTLASIAVFRAVIMIQPKRNRPSKRFAYNIMAISWICGAAFGLPYGLIHELRLFPDCIKPRVLKKCMFKDDPSSPVYDIAYFVLAFFIPFVLMAVSYGIVIFRIKQHIHCEGARKESIEMTSVTATTREGSMEIETAQSLGEKHQSSPNNAILRPVGQRLSLPNDKENRNNKSNIFKLEKDVLNLLYILILVFFICYLPWIIMYILKIIAKVPSVMVWPYFKIFDWYMTLMYSLPGALHPICYGAASKVIDIRLLK